jgi:hypothetical protein
MQHGNGVISQMRDQTPKFRSDTIAAIQLPE